MEKRRNSKIIILIILCLGVFCLSVGFSVYSTQLTVVSGAEVIPSADTFSVDFSTSSTSLVTGNVTPTKSSDDVEATVAKIDNSSQDSIITNLSVIFTEPGQSATYTFYAYNSGKYIAYLKNISFLDVQGNSSSKICTAVTGTTQSLMTSACAGINLSISVGNKTITNLTDSVITGHSLDKGASEKVVITISYTGTAEADGDFYVEFGDMQLNYSTVD